LTFLTEDDFKNAHCSLASYLVLSSSAL